MLSEKIKTRFLNLQRVPFCCSMQIFIPCVYELKSTVHNIQVPIRNPKSTASRSSSTVHLSMTRTPRGGSLDCKSQNWNQCSFCFTLHSKNKNQNKKIKQLLSLNFKKKEGGDKT